MKKMLSWLKYMINSYYISREYKKQVQLYHTCDYCRNQAFEAIKKSKKFVN